MARNHNTKQGPSDCIIGRMLTAGGLKFIVESCGFDANFCALMAVAVEI